MDIKTWDGITTLLGAVMGAGVLGIPFVVAKAGIIPGIVTILVLGIAVLILNLMVGEIALRTPGNHQLAGYMDLYLGKTGKFLMMLSLVIGIYGALIAYIIGLGETLPALLPGSPALWMFLAFVVLSALLSRRLKVIELAERFLSSGKIVAIAIVIVVAFVLGKFSTANLTPTTSWTLPFGVILFSLLGTAVIPDVREELKGSLTKLKPVLVWSSIIAIVIYMLFAISVVGVTGAGTTEIATLALGEHLGMAGLLLLNIFAILAMASAFLALGEALKKMFEEDYGWKPWPALFATVLIPAAVVLSGARSFIGVIGLTGAIAGGIDGVLIVLAYRKAVEKGKRRPEYSLHLPTILHWLVFAVFVFALLWAIGELR